MFTPGDDAGRGGYGPPDAHEPRLGRGPLPPALVLRKGEDVVVRSVDEARRLVENSGLQPFTSERFPPGTPAPPGTYRGDLLNTSDPTAPYVHAPEKTRNHPAHSSNPHYNLGAALLRRRCSSASAEAGELNERERLESLDARRIFRSSSPVGGRRRRATPLQFVLQKISRRLLSSSVRIRHGYENSAGIERLLDVSLVHAVVVDVREVAEAPGNLRIVTIHNDGDVTIGFETCADYVGGTDEGAGLRYVGHYESFDNLVRDLEVYLNSPVSAWGNYTATPYEPKNVEEPDPAANLKYFEELVRHRIMKLPVGGEFELTGMGVDLLRRPKTNRSRRVTGTNRRDPASLCR